jgi:hypothetical protein
MLLLLVAGAVSAQAQDDWFNDELYRFRQEKKSEGAEGYDPILSNKSKVALSVDPADETNQCIKVVAAQNATATTSQFWIRGAEVGGAGFAEGQGFRIRVRVKADSPCEVVASAHKDWGFVQNGTFGKVKVTEDWTTVSLPCVATNSTKNFTDLCLDLSNSDAQRTFYFDDIEILGRGSQWYVNNEFRAKDYLDPTATYGPDTDNPYPLARFVSDDDGGYVEVISNAGAANTYESQLWIAIPEKYVGTNTKMTMEVQASKAITVPENYQATATGKGWGSSAKPGDGLSFTVGEWVPVTRILKTKDVKSGAASSWGPGYPDRQVDQYCLDLSESTGDKESIIYKFRNVKFEDAEEPWVETMAYRVKVTPFDAEGVKKDDINFEPTYDFGDGGEEGGYFKVDVAGKKEQSYETQFFFQIADVAPTKELKANEKVNLKFKIKAIPTENLTAGTALTLGGGFHVSADGQGWSAGESGCPITVGEWSSVEKTFEISAGQKGLPTHYSIDLSYSTDDVTYLIDEVSATWEEAPVLDWVELIPAGDCETEAEHAFVVSKEMPKGLSFPVIAKIQDGVGVEGSKGVEVAASAKVSQPWDNQFWIYEPYALPAGTKILVEFDYKAEKAGSVGTQAHNAPSAYIHHTIIGSVPFETGWKHVKYEGKIANECDDNGVARFHSIAFNLNDIADANTYYFDNISFKVPAGTIDNIEAVYVDDLLDPTALNYTDLLVEDFEGEEVNAGLISKLVTGHTEKVPVDPEDPEGEKKNVTVLDDVDPELLPVVKSEVKANWKTDADEVELGSSALSLSVKPQVQDEAGEYKGAEYDSQFFIRLPKALPKNTFLKVEFDYWASKVASVSTQAHNDPGQYVGNDGIGALSFAEKEWKHFQQYVKVGQDMRTIAFNMSKEATGATYRFDNFKIQIADDFVGAADELTSTLDTKSLWVANALPLNIAINDAKQVETEGKGYTEESVQALEDAIAAGKAELTAYNTKDSETGEWGATSESLAQAKADVEAAVAGLEVAPVDCDLTADMYFRWDAVDATAKKTDDKLHPAYVVGTSTDMPYGDSNVNEYNFADLSAYDHLVIIATEGEPRLLFNRAAQDDHQGPVSVELPRDKEAKLYEAVVDNGDGSKAYVINLKAIVDKDGYAHLHAIKANGWGSTTTVTAMKLFVGESEYSDALTAIESVEETVSAKDGKYFIDGQIVIVKNGKKYNAAGVEIE